MSPPPTILRYADGQIVATLTTDAEGHATSEPLYLGTYTVYEAKAKDGYALDVAENTVALTYQARSLGVRRANRRGRRPDRVAPVKVDSLDGETPIEGAVFRIWTTRGDFDETLTTDESGVIDLKYLKHGSYHLQEVAAAEGYVISDVDEDGNAKTHDFEVNDQGMATLDGDSMQAKLAIVVENMPKTMGTTAADGDGGTHEARRAATCRLSTASPTRDASPAKPTK